MATSSTEESKMSERQAYFSELRKWVRQAHIQHSLSTCFPYYLLAIQNGSTAQTGGRGDTGLLNNNWLGGAGNAAGVRPPQPPQQRVLHANATPAEVIAHQGGYEFVVAPLYKRVIAEGIDFFLLFALKLAVTYIAVDYFNYIDVDSFDVEEFSKHFDNYKQAMEITSEIIVLECIYRLLVCLFEASCLWGGGATPGKALMGLRIVSARAVVSTVAGGRPAVIVNPGGDISFFTAVCDRSTWQSVCEVGEMALTPAQHPLTQLRATRALRGCERCLPCLTPRLPCRPVASIPLSSAAADG